jgi:single-stranded-DNA-specific exonuclease
MNTVLQNKTNTKNQMESVLQTLMNERNYTKNEAELTLKLIQIFGIDNEQTADDFLHIQNVKYHSPMLLKDINKVILRLVQAIVNKEKVMFHGDYDADGVTTTALFIKAMRKLGLDCDWYVPHRQKDGYGLHPRNIKRFEEQGYDLLVTGDTGIKEMKTISETTMDVIVTDHHEPVVSATREGLAQYEAFSTIIEKDGVFMAIPTCIGVINPHRIDCDYPNTAVAGVTVIFKVMSALYTHLNGDMAYLASLVDYVAVGMIADMIEQINLHNQDLESRKIVLAGIRQIEKATNTWSSTFVNLIAPLSKFESMKVRGLKVEEKKLYRQERNKGKITIGDLGFKIGPFLNAPGRMTTASLSVEFLL